MLRKATLASVLSATLTTTTIAQSGQMTAVEYDRAVNLLGPNLTGLVVGGTVDQHGIPAAGAFGHFHQPQRIG